MGDPVGERFQGEILKYDMGFWIFSRIAEGEAVFRSLGNGRFFAYHEGRTLGLAGWISRYRRDIYRSTMSTINNGKRLIPLRFEEDVIRGKEVFRRIAVYDYGVRKVFVETYREEEITREEVEIPFGVLYDDPMTAFYNFRSGIYGKVEPGKTFSIYTVPRGGRQKILRLMVASKEEAERRRAQEAEKEKKDLFITVYLDKDLVGSFQGLVEAWFSTDVVPTSGVAKDVFWWGDIRGKLTYQGWLNSSGNLNPSMGKD